MDEFYTNLNGYSKQASGKIFKKSGQYG